jgi:hypothetical protein
MPSSLSFAFFGCLHGVGRSESLKEEPQEGPARRSRHGQEVLVYASWMLFFVHRLPAITHASMPATSSYHPQKDYTHSCREENRTHAVELQRLDVYIAAGPKDCGGIRYCVHFSASKR